MLQIFRNGFDSRLELIAFDVRTVGCTIILPLSIFVMRTHFFDEILDADYEFDIVF